MEKVDKEWFRAHGFTVEEYEDGRIICMLKQDKKLVRWDYIAPNELNDSAYYQFYCSGNGFTINNNVSEEPFYDYQILSAMKIVGFNIENEND